MATFPRPIFALAEIAVVIAVITLLAIIALFGLFLRGNALTAREF